MQTPADQLAELDVRIANTRRRLMEAESSLSEMRAHGLPTRAIETSIEIMTDVLESMDRRRRLIKLEMDDQNRV